MKIILSRKGFDSKYGGYPSPILPDGTTMRSLPIPDLDDFVSYNELNFSAQYSYYDIMRMLNPYINFDKQRYKLTESTKCHFDPDISELVKHRKNPWKPLFGQINQAQSHLRNNGVKKGDIFLFFGWFKKTKFKNGKIHFDHAFPDLHVLFGYLQIDDIISTSNIDTVHDWMMDHPHIKHKERMAAETNTIYVGRKSASWNKKIPGSGIFNFHNSLVLTKDGCSRSRWDLPDCFRQVTISRHTKNSWKNDGYFQSVPIGQEFVVEGNLQIKNWAINLIEKNVLNSRIRTDR